MARQIPPEDERDRNTVAHGSLMIAAIAASTFACILTLVTLQRTDANIVWAMIAFCIALPLLVGHRFVTTNPVEKHRISHLHSFLPILGLFSFLAGAYLMIATVSHVAAIILVALSITMCFIIQGAEE